jgi:hypothetical protein
MAEKSLSPQAMREVTETDWNDAASVTRLEAHARSLFGALVAPLRKQRDPDADTKARTWTVGALVGAFRRSAREKVRPMVEQLVARVTASEKERMEERARQNVRKRGKK